MKKHEFGNRDSRELSRELSEAEKARLARFEAVSEELEKQGFHRSELTISIVKANIFAVILLIPLTFLGFSLLLWCNDAVQPFSTPRDLIILLVSFLILIVVHELIHGLSWAVFTEHHFKDIAFGFMKQYLTPYCACCVPLAKGQYCFGALMPLILLGILPMMIGILNGSMLLLLLGIIMSDSAAGDILIVWSVLRYRSTAYEVIYMDHPTQAGGVIFERE